MLTLLRAISESQAKLAVQPISAVCHIVEWGDIQPQCPDYRDLYRGVLKSPLKSTAIEIAAFLAITIQNALSIIVFAAFLIGTPLFVLAPAYLKRQAPEQTSRFLLAAFWLVYCGWVFAYVLIHFEDRYLAPVLPLSVFAGIFIILRIPRLKLKGA